MFGLFKKKNSADCTEVARKLKAFLQNQIDTIDNEGEPFHFDTITICYISHLVMLITKQPISPHLIHNTLVLVFPKQSRDYILFAMSNFHSDDEIEVKLAALFPIAKTEYEAGSGEFLIRNNRKINKDSRVSPGEGEAFDPRTAPDIPPWSAKDLA